jgi:hypothetical protein
MKSKQIKKIDDLPSEFSLEKYAPASSFDICDWTVNLEMRVLSHLMWVHNYGPFADEGPARSKYFLNNPIVKPGAMGEFEKAPGLSKFVNASSIRDFEAQDFYWHGRECAEDERQIKFISTFKQHFEESHTYESLDPCVKEKMETPYYKMLAECGILPNDCVMVKVDLHASDEKIKTDFSNWLSATRAAMGIVAPKKKFTKDDFDVWVKNAILPYLDLTAWARAHHFEITQQVLGLALFPNEYEVNLAERIRKVIAPMVKPMVSEVFTDALRMQAFEEIVESNSTKTLPVKFSNV